MMNNIDEKVLEYNKMFNDGFPMIPLAWGRTEKELVEIIDDCIKKRKNVYALGYVSNDSDLEY